VEGEEVERSLRELLKKGRVKEVPGRTLMYALAQPVMRLPRDTWMARVGALNSFAENLTNAAYGRFFREEPRAFARTVTFRGRAEVYERLSAFYESVVLPELQGLMSQEGEEPALDGESVQVSLCWAPYEYTREIAGEEGER
jgi:hypothetical protein